MGESLEQWAFSLDRTRQGGGLDDSGLARQPKTATERKVPTEASSKKSSSGCAVRCGDASSCAPVYSRGQAGFTIHRPGLR